MIDMGGPEPRAPWTQRAHGDLPPWRRYEERPLSGEYAGWFEGRVRTLWWHPLLWRHLARRAAGWPARLLTAIARHPLVGVVFFGGLGLYMLWLAMIALEARVWLVVALALGSALLSLWCVFDDWRRWRGGRRRR